jgi:CheY-like chemotaxis protein
MSDRVAVLVDDMFFVAKINNVAEACGREIARVRSLEQLEALASDQPSLVIVDLNSDRIDPFRAIASLKSRTELSTVPIVGFVSHVQTDLIRRAKAEGCDYVLPRSAFTQMLKEIISGNLASLRRSTDFSL